MPMTTHHDPSLWRHCPCIALRVVGVVALFGGTAPAMGDSAAPDAIRSRQIELHYQVTDAGESPEVELWYTRDRGTTWQQCGLDEDGASPMVFIAPAEGLYGLLMIVRDGAVASSPPPRPFDPPQRWVFVDYTPPLVQWDGVEAGDAFASRRTLQLRWTAHDDHLAGRPISLAWQSSVDGVWQTIDDALANVGRYDWTAPANLAGQVAFKLTVRDLGGHVVERVYGPFPVERWLHSPSANVATTHPAGPATTRPATAVRPTDLASLSPAVDMERRLKAQELHRQGLWHLKRGQHAVAAERFREALDSDPEFLAAVADLAGSFYLQQDYGKAIELYTQVLAKDQNSTAALRGAALAYVAQKQYAQSRDMYRRLLAIKENDAESWLDLGDVMFMMGNATDARLHWTRATTADPAADLVVRKARRRLELYGVTPGETPP
ncbi:MAG: hypothetical protein AMXMBFR13_40750 [Phycisphaerae bacterium]